MEGADEVLALREVDRGLAADRGVDLADQRRRHLDERAARACTSRRRTRRGRPPCRRRARRRRRPGAPPGWRAGAAASRTPAASWPPRPTAPSAAPTCTPARLDERRRERREPRGRRPPASATTKACAARPRSGRRVAAPAITPDADRHVVGPPRDRDGHAVQRSSSTIASATSPGIARCRRRRGGELPVQRLALARGAARRSPAARINGRSGVGLAPATREHRERHVQEHARARVAQRDPVRGLEHHPAAARDHRGVLRRGVQQRRGLERAEPRLALVVEDLGDRLARPRARSRRRGRRTAPRGGRRAPRRRWTCPSPGIPTR